MWIYGRVWTGQGWEEEVYLFRDIHGVLGLRYGDLVSTGSNALGEESQGTGSGELRTDPGHL